ncbi:hypothetical protein J6590_061128 [Homalodisca vitripennis]|nr:hypothetical protein J6590_061128 [Homalodisca vitripennis]
MNVYSRDFGNSEQLLGQPQTFQGCSQKARNIIIIQAPQGRPTGCRAIRRFKVHAITGTCGKTRGRPVVIVPLWLVVPGSSDNPFLCDVCENTLLSFTVSSEDQEKLKRFLYEHGVLQRTKVCPLEFDILLIGTISRDVFLSLTPRGKVLPKPALMAGGTCLNSITAN